jgi:hypothetical protein
MHMMTLPCGHTFHKQCLYEHDRKHRILTLCQAGYRTVTCFECQNRFDLPPYEQFQKDLECFDQDAATRYQIIRTIVSQLFEGAAYCFCGSFAVWLHAYATRNERPKWTYNDIDIAIKATVTERNLVIGDWLVRIMKKGQNGYDDDADVALGYIETVHEMYIYELDEPHIDLKPVFQCDLITVPDDKLPHHLLSTFDIDCCRVAVASGRCDSEIVFTLHTDLYINSHKSLSPKEDVRVKKRLSDRVQKYRERGFVVNDAVTPVTQHVTIARGTARGHTPKPMAKSTTPTAKYTPNKKLLQTSTYMAVAVKDKKDIVIEEDEEEDYESSDDDYE